MLRLPLRLAAAIVFAGLSTGLAACAGVAVPPPVASPGAPGLTFEPVTFKARDGTEIAAERGSFEVPEHRADPSSRRIRLSFVRFKATTATPSAPIVYLAGGPGGAGSETAAGARFPLFMRLRETADVIAFDQRGTGASDGPPFCVYDGAASDTPITKETLTEHYRAGLAKCFAEWTEKGVAIDGYTTRESADDIADLARALGEEKLALWGISYGSHLGLAVLKRHPRLVSRAVFAGIEGLDQTVKRPALTDAYFARAQALIDKDPQAKALYPDLAGLMRRVHARYDAEPARVSFTPRGAAEPFTIGFDGFAIRLLAGFQIADPSGLARLPLFYLALDAGQAEPAARSLHQVFFSGPMGFRGMPEAMDLASGVSPARRALIAREAKTALLDDALNFPIPHIVGLRPSLDLGDGFRAPFRSNVPVLFISGDLDGRTYPEEAREELKGFSRGRHLIVGNGGHNIFEADARIQAAVEAFLRGEETPDRIDFAPPVFARP